MSIERLLLGLLTSGISTLGFCLLMKLSPRRLPAAVLGGMLTNLIYDLVFFSFGNLLLSAFLSSLFMALYSDLGARVLRIPATLLIVPCIIPIVPGSYLYYTHLFIYSFTQNGLSRLYFMLDILGNIGKQTAISLYVISIIVGFWWIGWGQ